MIDFPENPPTIFFCNVYQSFEMINGMTIFVPFVVTMEVGFLVIVQYLTILLSLGFRSKSLDVGPKSGFDVQGHGLTGWLGSGPYV